jgi:predicted DNA-binding transcriptional regulator AlpA
MTSHSKIASPSKDAHLLPVRQVSPKSALVGALAMSSPKRLVTYPMLVERGLFNNRTTLSRAIKKYGFPQPYKLSPQRIAWDEDEVSTWLASRRA